MAANLEISGYIQESKTTIDGGRQVRRERESSIVPFRRQPKQRNETRNPSIIK